MQKQCDSPGVSALVLDKTFWEALTTFIKNPNTIKSQAQKWLKLQIDKLSNNEELTRIEERISKIREEEERYTKTYGQKLIDFEQLQTLLKDTKTRENIYKEQIKQIRLRVNEFGIAGISIDELVNEAIKVIESLDLNNKIKVIRDIIDRIIIKAKSREIEVCGHFPLPAVNMAYETIDRNCRATKRRKKHTI